STYYLRFQIYGGETRRLLIRPYVHAARIGNELSNIGSTAGDLKPAAVDKTRHDSWALSFGNMAYSLFESLVPIANRIKLLVPLSFFIEEQCHEFYPLPAGERGRFLPLHV